MLPPVVCYELFEHCLNNHALIVSSSIQVELREKLLGKFRFSGAEAEEAQRWLLATVEWVEPVPLEPPICRDPDDDWILATALSGRADGIVTGDQDLLVLGGFRGIPIVRPADFYRLGSEGSAG